MGYKEDREKRVDIFEDTLRRCEADKKLFAAIMKSQEGTVVYKEVVEPYFLEQYATYDEPCRISVTKRRTLEAAEQLYHEFKGSRIGILNFASATNPGGGVIQGSSAQEECLCRCSTLYPCLNTNEVWEQYYGYNRKKWDNLYGDSCIYTPGIIGFKTDVDFPEKRPEEEWFKVDIISCAAPNLRKRPSNAMNPYYGEKVDVSEEELLVLLERRIRAILSTACKKNIEVMVLGAFGCGAFCNPPEVVATAFKNALKEFRYSFKAIEFAVYCPPSHTENYDSFIRIL